jgi:diguanylate cyclase (GGDEF)-like protein/PAS domain S-box-containing protein
MANFLRLTHFTRKNLVILVTGFIVPIIFVVLFSQQQISHEKLEAQSFLHYQAIQIDELLEHSFYQLQKLKNNLTLEQAQTNDIDSYVDFITEHHEEILGFGISLDDKLSSVISTSASEAMLKELFDKQAPNSSIIDGLDDYIQLSGPFDVDGEIIFVATIPLSPQNTGMSFNSGALKQAISWSRLSKQFILGSDPTLHLDYTFSSLINKQQIPFYSSQKVIQENAISATFDIADQEFNLRAAPISGWLSNKFIALNVLSVFIWTCLMVVVSRHFMHSKLQQVNNEKKSKNLLAYQTSLLHLAKLDFTNKHQIITHVLCEASKALNTNRVSFWLYNKDKSAIELIGLCEDGKMSEPGLILSQTDFPAYFKALEQNGFITANDAHTHEATFEFSESYLKPLDIKSMLDAPVRIGGSPIGVICCEHKYNRREWTEDECNYVQSIADNCAKALLVEEKNQALQKLQQSKHVFENINEGIIISDANFIIQDMNPAVQDITGYKPEQLVGKKPELFKSGKHDQAFFDTMKATLKNEGTWKGEVWSRNSKGELYLELLTISAIKDSEDNIVNHISVFTDITDLKDNEKQQDRFKQYDDLTGLPNYDLFTDRFQQLIQDEKADLSNIAVCVLNLDNFRYIVDAQGIKISEQLLLEVVKQIHRCLQHYQHSLSRQDGDQFNFYIKGYTSTDELKQILARLQQSIAKATKIIPNELELTGSIGVTEYPDDNEHIELLLRHADQAMFQAKQMGKKRVQFYRPTTNEADTNEFDEFKQAIANDEFELFYQPKVNMRSGEVLGAEALIRWNHPTKGLLPPIAFLPKIDGTPLETELGNWVVKTAMQQLADWHEAGTQLELSINIAPSHIISNNFVNDLQQQLNRFPMVPSHNLTIEILESSAFVDIKQICAIVEQCQQFLGIRVALDDFGTGHSSLTHLRELKTDIIKIDRSFINDILDDFGDMSIVDSIVKFADSFDMSVIAEGVETERQGLLLLGLGCDIAQGYGIAKPMPDTEFEHWLKTYQPLSAWQNFIDLPISNKQRSLKIFKLLTEHWQKSVLESVKSEQPTLLLKENHCTCCHWLKKAEREKAIKNSTLEGLHQQHNLLHSIANKMIEASSDNALSSTEKLFKSAAERLNAMLDNKLD